MAKKNLPDLNNLPLDADAFKLLFENHPVPMWIYDLKTLAFLKVNEAAVEKYGYTNSEFLNLTIKDIRPPEDVDKLIEDLQKPRPALQQSGDWQHILKNGQIIDVQITSHTLGFNGRACALVIAQDVSEKKLAESALYQSEELFKNAFQYSAIGMALVSLEGKWLRVNQKLCEFFGYRESELFKFTFKDITHPDDLELDLKYLKQLLDGEFETYSMEKRYFHKDGHIVWGLLSVSLARDSTDQPAFFISQVEDITERKLANEKLLESEKRYRNFFDNSSIPLWEEDVSEAKKRLDELKQQGVTDFRAYFASHPDVVTELASLIKILDVNQAALNMYGAKSKEELIASSDSRSTGEIENNPEDFVAIAEGKTSNSWDGADKTLSGEALEISLNWSVVPGHEHDYSRIIVTTLDITKRKQAEQALHESELFAHSTLDALSAHIAVLNKDGIIIAVNQAWRKFADANPPINTNVSEGANYLAVCDSAKGVGSEGAKDMAAGIRAVIRGEENNFSFEYPCHAPHERRWFHLSVTGFGEKESRLVVVAHNNVSERFHAQQELQKSEERYKSIVENMPLVLYLDTADEESNSYYISPQIETLLGYSPSAYQGDRKLWHKQIAPQDYEIAVSTIQETLEQGNSVKQYRLITRDERVVWVRDTSVLIRDQNGKPKFIQGFIEDISEQKRAEAELQKSEERYKNIVEDMPMMMCRFTADGTLTFINEFYCQYFNKSYEQLIGTNLFDLIPAEEQETVKQKYLSLNQQNPFITYEYKTYDINGQVNWQRWTDRASFSKKGEIIEYQSIGEDITERKRSETILENENKLMQMIASGAGLKETLEAITKNVETFLHNGYCSILLLDKNGIHLRHGAAPSLPEEYIKAIDGIAIGDVGSCGTAAYRKKTIITADIATDPLWVDYKDIALKHGLRASWSTPIMNEGGLVYGTFAIYYSQTHSPKQDEIDLIDRARHQAKIVIEQKRANQVQEESERRYRSLFEDSPISLWEEDFSGVKQKIDELKQAGVKDFEAYFLEHPEFVIECASLVKILNVNKASVELYNAKSKEDLTTNMLRLLRVDGVIEQFTKELVQIANGKTHFEREEMDSSLSGEPLVVSIFWSVMPGHEEDLSHVIVSIVDITERKQAEEERRVLIEELGERVKELTFLHNISRIFMDSLRPVDEVMQSVVEMMPDAFKYPEMAVARIGFNGSQFTTPNFKQTDWMISEFFDYPGGNLGVVQVAYLEERPLADIGPFLEEERSLLVSMAEKLQTYLKGLSADRAINRQLTELETLYESGLEISQLLTPKEIAQKVIGVLERKLDWHHIAIREYDSESNSVKLIGFNKPDLSLQGIEAHINKANNMITNPSQGLSGWVTTHGKSILLGNVKTDERYVSVFPDIQSGMYVPLKLGEKIIGSISVESQEENAFTEHDQRLLETLAGQAAIAIENANLFNELEKRVQERTMQIETTKRRLELATHAGQIGVWEYKPRENSVVWDERMHIIHHMPVGAFDGKPETWAKYIHPDDITKSQINSQLAFTENLLLNNEHRIILPDGNIRYISTSAVTVFGEDNTPERIIGICRDVTERKHIEKNLEESESYARLLFDAAPDPVFVMESDGTMVDVNKFFEMQHQINRESLQGKNISALNLFPPEELRKANEYLTEVMTGESIPPVELKFYAPDDELHTLELHSYPIEVQGRTLLLSTSRDITTHKKFEEALKLANAEMENALRVKDEFLANMSHELRTPLNAILGISESLEEQMIGKLNEKQQKYVGIIKESGKHLLDLINDILDISKIEAGRMELTFHRIGVEKLCQSSLRMIKELAQKKNIQVSFKIHGEIATIMGDERRLKQVLVNLLSNAVKFTEENNKIGLEVRGYPQRNEVTFSVWDTGIGIAEEDLKFLFKPFVQLDAGLAREFQGTGLGLALVAQMVRLHGGSVNVKSEIGKGSMFTITLPWEREEQNAPAKVTGELVLPSQKSHEKRKGTILLVEDTDIIVSLVKDYLTYKGYEVIVAYNGREGIYLAKEKQPDLILMDVMMPIMNGIDATIEMRKDKNLSRVPIIALTALAMPGDRERCLEAGMTDYMSKPVQLNELIEIIEKYITQD